MTRQFYAAIAAAGAFASSVAWAQTPAESVTLRGTPAALSSCAFLKLEREGLRKTDLQGAARIEFVPGTMRVWLLSFEVAGAGQTRVTFTKSFWDPHDVYRYVMPAVRSCGAVNS